MKAFFWIHRMWHRLLADYTASPRRAQVTQRDGGVFAKILLVCALLSGAAGLLYQVIWNRELLLLFGSTSAAAAAVVAAFMGGMGIGAWGIRHFLVRHQPAKLGLYALLELGIAGYALLFHPLLSWLQTLYPGLWHAALGDPMQLNLLRLGLGLVILGLPTLAMGATLPLLISALQSDHSRASKSVGWIYGLNAGGGALGAALAGLLLLPALGLTGTRFAGVLLSVAAALLAFLARFARAAFLPTRPSTPELTSEVQSRLNPYPMSRRIMSLALIGTGFASMGYEVLWTRMLVLITGSSTYAFSLMLALYVAGVGLGSLWLAAKVARLRTPGDVFAHLQIGVAVLVIAGLWLFAHYPGWQLELYQTWGVNFAVGLAIDAILAALIIVPPTLLLGAAFPVAIEALGSRDRAGSTSTVLATVALGNAAGALVAGSVLVPWLGLKDALVALASLSGLCALVVAFTHFSSVAGRRVSAATGIVLVALGSLLVPHWDPLLLTSGVYERAPVYLNLLGGSVHLDRLLKTYRLLDYQEGNQAVVSVIRFPTLRTRPHLALSIDGKVDASTGKDMSTQILSGDIGMLLRPAARNVLVVGLASGVTAGSVEQWPGVKHLVVAEISPAVVRAARWFAPFNHDALRDPRLHLVLDDARHYLNVTRRHFQVAVSEPSNPWLSGPARLFTQQFFRLVRDHLTPDGVFVQWVPLYGLSTPLLKAEVRTFLSVFPHVVMLRVSTGDLVLVGGNQSLTPPTGHPLPPTVSADLARIHSDRWKLLARFVASTQGLHQWVGTGPLNTDDNGLLEFGAPRYLLAPTLQANIDSVNSIPWRKDLMHWGANAPLKLAHAELQRGETDHAALLTDLALPGKKRWSLQGDIAMRQGNWITAADDWRRAGTALAALHLTELALSDGQTLRASRALARVEPGSRTPYFHYLAMLVALQRSDLKAASAEARQLPLDDKPDAGWQVLAAFFEESITRRLGKDAPAPAAASATFDQMLDHLRRKLEREQGEPILDDLLRRLRDLPPGLLDAGDEQRFQQALRTRLLGPLERYNRGVSLFFMGRFDAAEQVLQEYIRALPAGDKSSFAHVLIKRANNDQGEHQQ